MKRINDARKLFGITKEVELSELKIIYRNLIKEWHPDKFQDEDAKQEAEMKSTAIIEAYHFLVSLSPETNEKNKEQYNVTISTSGIDDYQYKGQVLKVIFNDGSVYEYFGVPQNAYQKLMNSATPVRFARRHIFENYIFRKALKGAEKD